MEMETELLKTNYKKIADLREIKIGLAMSDSCFFIKQQSRSRFGIRALFENKFRVLCNFKARVGDSFDFTFYSIDHGSVTGRAIVKESENQSNKHHLNHITFVIKKFKGKKRDVYQKILTSLAF